MVYYSRRMVYAYVPNFILIGFFCRLCCRKNPILAVFWTSAFSVVINWHQSDKVEHGCTTTNLPLSNGIKIVSVLQRLHSEIWRTISDVQKCDEQTDKQTDKQKKLETVSIAEPLQNRQHARLMLSTLERKGKREG